VCEPYSRWGPVFSQGKDIFKGALPYDAAFCPNSLTFTACYNLETALFRKAIDRPGGVRIIFQDSCVVVSLLKATFEYVLVRIACTLADLGFFRGGGAPVGNPSERSERVLRGLGLRENET